MTEFLIFQVYGPSQAWGDIAVGEIRPVVDHPGRSGIAGLLAASLGLISHRPGRRRLSSPCRGSPHCGPSGNADCR